MRSQSLRHVPGSLNRAPRHEHSEVLVGYVGCACPSTSTEPPRCRPQPYWRSLQKRQARGVRSSAAHGMASSWRSTSSWGGRRAAIRRLGRPARARRSALQRCPVAPLTAWARAGRHAHNSPPGLGRGAHAGAWGPARRAPPGHPRARGSRSNRTPLAPRERQGGPRAPRGANDAEPPRSTR